jgi:hypothetical protein
MTTIVAVITATVVATTYRDNRRNDNPQRNDNHHDSGNHAPSYSHVNPPTIAAKAGTTIAMTTIMAMRMITTGMAATEPQQLAIIAMKQQVGIIIGDWNRIRTTTTAALCRGLDYARHRYPIGR